MCHVCGNLLEIDFVYLEFSLKDPRCEHSASQQVLNDTGGTRER